MSSTVTTFAQTGAPAPPSRAQIPPEAAAALDASETVWLTPAEFAQRRDLGWCDRSVLQKAVGRNACGLKDARRRRTGEARVIWEYPEWRVKHYLKFGIDGTGPTHHRRSKRVIAEPPPPIADPITADLAALTGLQPLQVLHDVAIGKLEATLHPSEDRFLFLRADSALRWIEDKTTEADDETTEND